MDEENLWPIVMWEETVDASWDKDSVVEIITNLTLG